MVKKDDITKTYTSDNRRFADLANGAKFLSGFRKTDRITPVVTLTLYWGAEEWDAPRSLHEMFEGDVAPEIRRLVPDYSINLVSPAEITDFTKFHTELGAVLKLIQTVKDKKRMRELLDTDPVYENMDQESAAVLSVMTSLKFKFQEGETVNMCKALEDYGQEMEQKGREEGREETFLEAIRNVMNALKVTADQAMDILKIVPEKRSFYKERI